MIFNNKIVEYHISFWYNYYKNLIDEEISKIIYQKNTESY